PRCETFTPAMLICSTRPSNPSSAITRLLPPPSTNSGTPRASAHSFASKTSSTLAARANQRAAPPIPGVLSGASATCSRASNATQCLLLLAQCPLLLPQCRDRLRARAHRELDPVARRELSGLRQVSRDDGRDLRIPARGLPIGHQQDWLARRRN